MKKKVRKEKDFLGEMEIPNSAYYGIHTLRAVRNFPISGLKSPISLINAIVMVKWACAEANMACQKLDRLIGKMIQKAALEIIEGKWRDQFVVDVFQAGAGTSFNMNANEVIANRAGELQGGTRGAYELIHPNDHVNMSQSTNDVYPTAMRIASLFAIQNLLVAVSDMKTSLDVKAKAFNRVIKSGRTHLQDAVPVRLGQEFSGYAKAIGRAGRRIETATGGLREVGLGGSAVGTGINTHPQFQRKVVSALKKISHLPLTASDNLFERMQSMADFVELSGALRELAVEFIRIANDLRLLSSGPRTGLAEINLPPVQAGSSIMPGKVNPVMAEVTDMVCFQVIGNDTTITLAAQAGQLELNVMMPVIAYNLLQSIEILTNAIDLFNYKCIKGITVNKKKCLEYAESSIGLATILNQIIGYNAAANAVKQAVATGKSLRDILKAGDIVSPQKIEKILNLFDMTEPQFKSMERY